MNKIIKKIGVVEQFNELQSFCIELHNKLNLNQISIQVSKSNRDWSQSSNRLSRESDEFLFDRLHPDLKNSVIEHTLNKIPFKIWRLRLMALEPGSKYSWHIDPTPRIHIPIFTDKQCLFQFPRNLISENLKADGSIYWTDTRYMHSFVNFSNITRLHLVGVVDE
jgi:hypothetical protein